MGLYLSTASLSLFDSLSTAQQIIVFVLLLNTLRPVRNVLFYLSGLSGTYFLAGLVGCLAFEPLRDLFRQMPFSTDSIPDSGYHQMELLGGLVMAGIGLRHYRRNRHLEGAGSEARLLARITARFGHIGGRGSFWIGVFISATTLPCSVPYFLALGKYAALHLGATGEARWVLLYNLGYASPMLAILGIYLWQSHRMADLSQDLVREKARLLNLHLTTWALAGVGLLSIVDAGWYFLLGHALFKGRLL
jgi:hypothetical protein